jgi:SAM-dependent methyltransferase
VNPEVQRPRPACRCRATLSLALYSGLMRTYSLPRALPSQLDFWNRWHERTYFDLDGPDRTASRTSLLNALPGEDPADVLDLGCGQGRDAICFRRCGLRVVGVDHSPIAIERAKNAASQRGLQLMLAVHDIADRLPFRDRQFSGIYAHLSLHYFDDDTTRRVFGEIRRVIKPGGVLLFSVRSVLDPLYGQGDLVDKDMYCLRGHVRHFFSEDYAREIMSEWNLARLTPYENPAASPNPGRFIRVTASRPTC